LKAFWIFALQSLFLLLKASGLWFSSRPSERCVSCSRGRWAIQDCLCLQPQCS